jgi:hypothetical protein
MKWMMDYSYGGWWVDVIQVKLNNHEAYGAISYS